VGLASLLRARSPAALGACAVLATVALIAGGAAMSACDSAAPLDCAANCDDARQAILAVGRDPDGNPLPQDEDPCDRDAIRTAVSCADCRRAFADEFALVSDEHKCTCPEQGDTIMLTREDCSSDEVAPDFFSCSELDSDAHRDRVAQCIQDV